MAIDEFARPIDLKNQPGDDEKKLLEQLKGLVSEADESKKRQLKRYDETSDEDDLKVYRGEIGPKEKFFDCNFVQAFIDRQVAQLTDNRPILRVENRKIGLHDVARVLQKAILNVWDQSNVQRNTFKMAYSAAVSRSAGMYTGWDPVAEDIYLEVIRKDQVRIDPCVTEAAMLNEAEYIIIERIKPIAEIKRRFGARGFLVKSDVQLHPGESKKPTVFSALTDILKSKSSQGLKDAIPRAYIYEAIVKDRQVDIQNRPLFPFGRQIFFSDDVVLYDGPLSFWDGNVPLDWFDWIVDPEHIWGHSEPYRLRKLQSSFNQIMDGTVENHIITNVLAVIGDYDALSREDWQTLQNMRGTMILRKRNRAATVDVKPPPPFGADKIQLARTLFTYGQLLTGVTDVTMGETPGSLQSGLAIEGLQEGANLMTRSRASRLEDFYNRVGQKLISRILQFVPSDRILSALGPTKEALEYAKNRADLFIDDDGNPIKFEARRDALKWLRFSVLPGSSQPGTRQRRAQGMMALHGAGMASRRRVLEAADFHDTDTMLAEAEADFQKFPPPGWVKKGPN